MTNKRLAARVCALCAALGTSGLVVAQPVPDFADIPYAFVHARQALDIYLPDGPGPFPVVVWVHGGAWAGGDKSSAAYYAGLLLPHGIAVVGVNYRLSQHGDFPVQIYDVKGAIRWIRAHANTYGFDAARIGAWGSSAGGHLVALLGTSGDVAALEGDAGNNLTFSSRVQAVADYFGPTDLLHINLDVTTPPGSALDHDAPNSPESHLIGFDQPGQGIGVLRANQSNPNPPFPQYMALVTAANPITHVTPDDPIFYIAHGDSDQVVPRAQSAKLASALAAAGVPFTHDVVPGAGHGMPPTEDALIVQFFLQQFQLSTSTPTVGTWGMVALSLMVATAGSLLLMRGHGRAHLK